MCSSDLSGELKQGRRKIGMGLQALPEMPFGSGELSGVAVANLHQAFHEVAQCLSGGEIVGERRSAVVALANVGLHRRIEPIATAIDGSNH